MITNANRSGTLRVKFDEPRDEKPQDDNRSGRISEQPPRPKAKRFGLEKSQEIVSVDGRLELMDKN